MNNPNKKPRNFWHLVDPSPWPFIVSFSSLNMFIGFVLVLNAVKNSLWIVIIGLFLVICSIYFWFKEIILETKLNGSLTEEARKGLKIGMLLFIASEIMFFVAFFWAHYHFGLAPASDIGGNWPPRGIQVFNPYGIPLLNTLILLLSGVFVTWTHNELIVKHDLELEHYEEIITPWGPKNMYRHYYKIVQRANVDNVPERVNSIFSLFIAIVLAMIFTGYQLHEYIVASYHIADGVYTCDFFMATGFHGFHVILGTVFLLVSFFRLLFSHFTRESHLGLEFAIWYWHFVDVVWLFLFISIYWWGWHSF